MNDANAPMRRLGRSVARIHQASPFNDAILAAQIDSILICGSAMDFVARIHGFKGRLQAQAITGFAAQAGLGSQVLKSLVLPKLKAADIIDYSIQSDNVVSITDFLGVSGGLIDQMYRLLGVLEPSRTEWALLHSVEIASWAPLVSAAHLDQIVRRGFTDKEAEDASKLALALGVNSRVHSPHLNEHVIYNPYVWESGQIQIAQFLHSLGPNERDVMLGICEQATATPGIALNQVENSERRVVNAARKVGLIQATTVKSMAGGASQTYIFSPTLDSDDDKLVTTEALHQRKLFVAHILYGHEKAKQFGGRINDPTLLVSKLIDRGTVGPATNIGTDYHLLETHGIVRVEKSSGDRAFLHLVKEEIAQGGLAWIEKSGALESPTAKMSVKLGRSPGMFTNPERDRANLPDDAAANEVLAATVLKLREEVQSAARQDAPF